MQRRPNACMVQNDWLRINKCLVPFPMSKDQLFTSLSLNYIHVTHYIPAHVNMKYVHILASTYTMSKPELFRIHNPMSFHELWVYENMQLQFKWVLCHKTSMSSHVQQWLGRTGNWLQMDRTSSRKNLSKLKTTRKLPATEEEFIESTPF